MDRALKLIQDAIQVGNVILKKTQELMPSLEPQGLDEHRIYFVYRHLHYVVSLAEETTEHVSAYKRASSRLAVRTMFESAFNIGAAARRPTFALEKTILEMDEDFRKTSQFAKDSADPTFGACAKNLSETASELRGKYGLTPSREIGKVYKIAEIAGMERDYALSYPFWSNLIHGRTSGLLFHRIEIGHGLTLDGVLRALILALGSAASALPLSDPPLYQNQVRLFVVQHGILARDEVFTIFPD